MRCVPLLALLLGALPVAAMADEACSLKRIASADAELTPNDLLVVHTKINDQPVLMGIDTGAAISVMFDGPAARLGLPRTPIKEFIYGVDGRMLSQQAEVRKLQIGGRFRSHDDFPVSPSDAGNPDIVGLLGSDYLSNYDLEIDLADHEVNLFDQDHCPGKVVYWTNSYNASDVHIDPITGEIRIYVDLDGDRIGAVIDTGASQTALRLSAARGRFGLSSDSPGVERIGDSVGIGGQQMPLYRYGFKTLKFGDLTIHNPSVDLLSMRDGFMPLDTRVSSSDMPDMLVGMSLLKHLRLYIAYGERRIYYTVVEPAAGR
jgi:predicted aspartyl protease